jgi:hypothetical protein
VLVAHPLPLQPANEPYTAANVTRTKRAAVMCAHGGVKHPSSDHPGNRVPLRTPRSNSLRVVAVITAPMHGALPSGHDSRARLFTAAARTRSAHAQWLLNFSTYVS